MARRKKATVDFPEDLSLLDDLIKQCYRELSRSITENAKLGDFIKMIELRRKLAPGETDQKKFWTMLEKVRKEVLANKTGTSTPNRRKRNGR